MVPSGVETPAEEAVEEKKEVVEAPIAPVVD
jgi:hypothetical protein